MGEDFSLVLVACCWLVICRACVSFAGPDVRFLKLVWLRRCCILAMPWVGSRARIRMKPTSSLEGYFMVRLKSQWMP